MNGDSTGQLIQGYLSGQAQHISQVHNTFLQFLPNRVENIRSGNMKEWLEKEPEKARVMLVTAKTTTPSMFIKLALDHGDGVLFGELRQSSPGALEEWEKLGGQKVDKFPKLLFGKALGKGWAAPSEVYAGKLGVVPIGEAIAKINPGPRVVELSSEEDMQTECAAKGGICVIAVLPNRFDKHLDIFKKVARRSFGSDMVLAHFMWINEEKQEPFVEGLKVENFPGVVSINTRKKIYSNFIGTFNEKTLYEYVVRVIQGKESLTKIDTFPKLLKSSPTLGAGGLDALLGGKKKEL